MRQNDYSERFVVVVKLAAAPNLMMIMEEVGCCWYLIWPGLWTFQYGNRLFKNQTVMLGRGLRFKPLFIQHNFVVVVKLVATPNLMMIMEEVGCCSSHLSTAVAWREKKRKHFVFNKFFFLVLGVLKSRISEKVNQLLLNKLDFKLFHCKARVQPVHKITTIATRNRC